MMAAVRHAWIAWLLACACGRVEFGELDDAGTMDGAADLCAELVAHFKLDESGGATALDSVSQVNASVNGTVSFDPTGGVVGGAALFSSDGFINITRTQDFPVADFTLSLWIKPTDLTNRTALQSRDASGRSVLLLKWARAEDLEAFINGAAVVNDIPGFTADSTWQHVVITRAGAALTVYRNGMAVGNATDDGALIAVVPGCVFRIGASTNCSGTALGSEIWQGQLDDLRLYRREIPALAVDLLYRSSLAGDVPSC